MSHIKRLTRELTQSSASPLPPYLTHLSPVSDDNITHWTATLHGPPSTAYASGRWQLDINVPEEYPLKPPSVRFVTRIAHPNVNFTVSVFFFLPLYLSSSSLEQKKALNTNTYIVNRHDGFSHGQVIKNRQEKYA
jgi:hypothetical protein